ncbi:hypothetical protein [Robertkochia aurantiaca]|uniref:hypothetical protein n=1 Tax=Robertkochia aurantiaca TaxID=2873700 RepID=UPI001CCA8A17|nr:hypothetical protein [Robertkochia sp. 3YJGBD-33]
MNRTTSYLHIYKLLSNQKQGAVSKIQALIENDDLSASDEMYAWLQKLEDVLRRNRFVQFNDIAKYRANLLSSRIAIDRRIPRKKQQLEAALALITPVTKTLEDVMKPIEKSLEEIHQTIRELLIEANERGDAKWNNGLDFSEFIHALWRHFIYKDPYKQRALPILQVISENDALEILASEFHKTRTRSEKNHTQEI